MPPRLYEACCEICKLPCHYLLASSRNSARIQDDVDAPWPTLTPRSPRAHIVLGVKKCNWQSARQRTVDSCGSDRSRNCGIVELGCNPLSAYTLKSSDQPNPTEPNRTDELEPADSW